MTGIYALGTIPPQTIWSGEVLSFRITSTLGNGVVFSLQCTPVPEGAIALDGKTGRFQYTPTLNDREAITVRFTAKAGDKEEKQEVSVTPLPRLPSDYNLLEHAAKTPDPESRSHIQTSEQDAGKAVFNNTGNTQVPIDTKEVSISGMKLVFEQNSKTYPLFDQYNHRPNIQRLNMYADEIVIRSPLKLPGTTVHIHARSLRFEGDGSLDTTPLCVEIPSDQDVGLNGASAGNIYLYSKRLDTPGSTVRLIANGGKGQAARPGVKGEDGKSISYIWDGHREIPSWYRLTKAKLDWSNEFGKLAGYQPVHASIKRHYDTIQGMFEDLDTDEIGSKIWPEDGKDAKVKPGQPGVGGNAGTVYAPAGGKLDGCSQFNGGRAGDKAKDLPPSAAGNPVNSCWVEAECWFSVFAFEPNSQKLTLTQKHESKPGAPCKAPDPAKPAGDNGSVRTLERSDAGYWLHPAAVRVVTQYLRDAFLAGHAEPLRPLIDEYLDAMRAAEQANQGGFEMDALHAELSGLVRRIDGPYDYFGNPAGWVPMLSFESNLALYEKELDGAVRMMFLSYWIEKNQASAMQSADALSKGVACLVKEIQTAVGDYKTAQEKLADLDGQYNNIQAGIKGYLDDLETLEKDLRNQVKGDLQAEHIIRSSGKLLGGILQMIPAGQPALGAIGKGLSALAELDPDSPFDTVKTLASELWDSKLVQDKLKPKAAALVESYLGIAPDDGEEKKDKFDKDVEKEKLKEKVKKHLKEEKEVKEQVTKALANFTVPEDEIDEALEQVKAKCPQYTAMAKKAEALNGEKAAFAQKIQTVMHALDAASETILTSSLSLIELRAQRTTTLDQINHEAWQYARAMGQRARTRLAKYQYYLIKSYNYLMLRDLPGLDYDAQYMFDAFAKMLASSQDGSLAAEQYQSLRSVFEDQLEKIAESLIDWYQKHKPKSGGAFLVSLTPGQIQALNQDAGKASINLMEMGYLFLDQEDIRITDIKTHGVNLIDPPKGMSVNVKLEYRHSGVSILRRGGQLFAFRSGDYSAATKSEGQSYSNDHMYWGTTISHDSGEKTSLTPIKPDPAEESLIRHLLQGIDAKGRDVSPLIQYQPSAWTDIAIRRTVSPRTYAGKIDRLDLEIEYVYHPIPDRLQTLYVYVPGGMKPCIRCNTTDLNNRTDGYGSFLRTFDASRVREIRLTAPAAYGKCRFMGWRRLGEEVAGDVIRFTPLLTPAGAELFGEIEHLVEPGSSADVKGEWFQKLVQERTIAIDITRDQYLVAVYLPPA